ncbi:MarR family transcriptional regulator [Streptomyces sp. NPDC095613]|uniref:MarR family winged helix-turn-helix transcriptional regulator n=1 Tax=Streptomyces sp. NPDC095613 TaxID=3155540 RepID=UPI003333208D
MVASFDFEREEELRRWVPDPVRCSVAYLCTALYGPAHLCAPRPRLPPAPYPDIAEGLIDGGPGSFGRGEWEGRAMGDLGERHAVAGADDVVSVVMAAARLVMGMSARALAEVDESMSLPQLRTLVALEGCGPVKLVELADVLGVNPSTALRAVARLESTGLVDRRTNPDSRREVVLSLTPRGEELAKKVLAHRRREVEKLVEGVPAQVRAGLVDGLCALLAAAGDRSIAVPGTAEEFRRTVP